MGSEASIKHLSRNPGDAWYFQQLQLACGFYIDQISRFEIPGRNNTATIELERRLDGGDNCQAAERPSAFRYDERPLQQYLNTSTSFVYFSYFDDDAADENHISGMAARDVTGMRGVGFWTIQWLRSGVWSVGSTATRYECREDDQGAHAG